ncbi:ABC transporter permease [Actinomadura sp. 7K534]|uniref:ABC transporter permease n=1 Tax=Actinomadura sp. 7K534 TaxID=2530366 RepID=UPI00104F42D0|nr:ABC transporter permease [Actinomadura sp. 7K534]TDB99254.1 ABC transporter permease [Actinomadura sp. 7K534]
MVDVEPSRLSVRDMAAEAAAGIAQRPGRSALTTLGTVLGVGAFVAILGLTSTASGQISEQFNVLTATTVTVKTVDDRGFGESPGVRPATGTEPVDSAFPADSDARITRLNGVDTAGTWRRVHFDGDPVIAASPEVRPGSSTSLGGISPVFAASPGMLRAAEASVTRGTPYNGFHERRGERVAVLGATAAQHLGVTRLDSRPAVFINQQAFTIVGIIGDTRQMPELLAGVIIPRGTADRLYGPASVESPEEMLIRTRLGAAALIAGQAPTALRPEDPGLFTAVPPPDPRSLREKVDQDLTGLFLVLAAICLTIGTLGIANTTFVAVLERRAEIGLRRSLGARPRHIAAQFLAESTSLGLLGGMVGTCLAIATVAGVAVVQDWTAVLAPVAVLPAPLIGALTGLIAGLYPALRAARIEPQKALRQ